jgi:hypothetical protein
LFFSSNCEEKDGKGCSLKKQNIFSKKKKNYPFENLTPLPFPIPLSTYGIKE